MRRYCCSLIAAVIPTLVACRDSSPRPAARNAAVDSLEVVRHWARTIDSLALAAQPREFGFPPRSTEGGKGRFYQLSDSSVRIDVDDLGEMGRHQQRYYARGTSLRLAVSSNDRYDSPLSGNVVRSVVDSVWFVGDSAVSWVDSARVVRARPDSLLRAHGAEVLGEFLWAVRMAGMKPGAPDSGVPRKPPGKH